MRQTDGKAIEVPKRTGQFSAVRVVEQSTRSETTGLAYGLETINAPEAYALIDVSNQILEDSAFDFEEEIRTESEMQFAVLEGAEFVNGSGVGEMEGILVTSNIGTTKTGAATTVTADGLIDLKYAIKSAYARNASWIMNRKTIGSVRKLKDSQGQYLWQPGLAQGRPNTIDGDPYVEFPDMPDEGAGAKPVGYGDWRRAYTMVNRIDMALLRDPYSRATSGEVRFHFRRRSGGQVTLAEAVQLNVCAA